MKPRRYSKTNERAFLTIISIIFLLLTLYVLKDVFFLIIYSLILSYFLYPLYKFYQEKFHNKRISSLVTLITATVGFFIPLALLSYFLILNLVKLIVKYKTYIENPQILNQLLQESIEKISGSNILSNLNITDFLNSAVIFIVDLSKNFFSSIPISFAYFLIVLFITYYILIYNKNMISGMNEYIPLTLKKQNEILKNITKNLKVLFKGYFLTGLIQTAVAFLGYIIFSVPNILIITFLTLIVSLIPYIGTPIIWVPISFYLILIGQSFNGIGLLIYGITIISLIDNFVRPQLMSSKETIPAPLVFIGFIGGLIAFGIEGIVIGPIIISITSILLRYLKEEYELKPENN